MIHTSSFRSTFQHKNTYTSLDKSSLVKRGSIDPKWNKLYNIVRHGPGVKQDKKGFMPFGSEPATFGSAGFAGCSAVVITSSKGVIIGHYCNSPPSTDQAKDKVAGLIKDNKDALDGAKAWVYRHVRLLKPDEFTAERQLQQLEDIVKNGLGITPKRMKYIEPADILLNGNGEIDMDKAEKYPEDEMSGSVLVQHPGGPSQESTVTFVSLDWQKAGTILD